MKTIVDNLTLNFSNRVQTGSNRKWCHVASFHRIHRIHRSHQREPRWWH